eukprot:1920387-Pleurochrysis_carterae.AAC.2
MADSAESHEYVSQSDARPNHVCARSRQHERQIKQSGRPCAKSARTEPWENDVNRRLVPATAFDLQKRPGTPSA